jgi:mono/diheme cytochrome c family protein
MIRVMAVVVFGLVLGCTSKSDSGQQLSKTEQIRYEQYFVEGQQLYNLHCSNCHQSNGEGLGKLFPPIKSSDFLEQNFDQVICLIKNGISGEIAVNGITYNQPMPGVSELTALEVAEITTYIYNNWGHSRGYIDVKSVTKVLESCEAHHE